MTIQMKERLEKILHDGLVEDNYIGRKWRVEMGDVVENGYQFMTIQFYVFRARCRKPIACIDASVDTFRIQIDVSKYFKYEPYWFDKYWDEIVKQNMYSD